jgi:hypothetical protein
MKRDHGLSLDGQQDSLKAHMFKKSWVPGLVLGITQGVMAQTMPSAGSQMQQIPVAPMAPPALPAMEVPAPPVSSAAEPLEQEALFVAQRLGIVGGTVYPESALLAMTGFEAGATMARTKPEIQR